MKLCLMAIAVLFVLTGCGSGPSVHTEYDTTWDFADYKTWQWRYAEAPASEDPRLNNPELRDRIRREVTRAMAERGYTYVPEGGDLLVQIQAHVDDKSFSRPNFGSEGYRETDQWAEGLLSVGIRDAAEDLLIWQGSAHGDFKPSTPKEERLEKVDELVDTIISKFPPK